ncbi:unnamed protein product [Mycena citricolor]|uniref:Uncharacterized protein n=1 Tax=Mycena citricolor TaxID=2018698 RepID=A0AAD2K8M7_9AGAR|nr:unnamed protein product [Mycena citricolor]
MTRETDSILPAKQITALAASLALRPYRVSSYFFLDQPKGEPHRSRSNETLAEALPHPGVLSFWDVLPHSQMSPSRGDPRASGFSDRPRAKRPIRRRPRLLLVARGHGRHCNQLYLRQ